MDSKHFEYAAIGEAEITTYQQALDYVLRVRMMLQDFAENTSTPTTEKIHTIHLPQLLGYR